MTNNPLWDRAAHISFFSCLRINTTDELEDFHETKNLYKIYTDAAESEKIIKRELLDLFIHRKAFITTIDELMECAENNQKADEQPFWDEIKRILMEENDKFKIDLDHK